MDPERLNDLPPCCYDAAHATPPDWDHILNTRAHLHIDALAIPGPVPVEYRGLLEGTPDEHDLPPEWESSDPWVEPGRGKYAAGLES